MSDCKHGFRPAADCIICERDALRAALLKVSHAAEKALTVWGTPTARRYVCEILDVAHAAETNG